MLAVNLQDFILVPIYIVLLNIFFRYVSKKYYPDSPLGKYLMVGLRIKIFFGLMFALFSIFLVPGDTQMYFTSGLDFKQFIWNDFSKIGLYFGPAQEFGEFYESKSLHTENFGYVMAEGNFMAIKAVTLISVFCFNSYILTSILFSVFSFCGLWLMFRTFSTIYPSYKKAIFLCFFLIPSVLFWGSGILKDTLCLGFLGIGFYFSHLFFLQKQHHIKYLIAILFCFYCLYLTKSYIAYAFIPCFLFWYFLSRIAFKDNLLATILWVSVPIFIAIFYIIFGNFNQVVADISVENLAENMQVTKQNYENATPDDGAFLDYGEIVPTPAGIIRLIPKALIASLFRPFLWEANKLTSLMAALEGTFFFLFTIYVFFRNGFIKSIMIIISDSTILFCFSFSIVFAIAIGLNCFNLGTLVRYKIPCLPFYLLSLVFIAKKKQLNAKKIMAIEST